MSKHSATSYSCQTHHNAQQAIHNPNEEGENDPRPPPTSQHLLHDEHVSATDTTTSTQTAANSTVAKQNAKSSAVKLNDQRPNNPCGCLCSSSCSTICAKLSCLGAEVNLVDKNNVGGTVCDGMEEKAGKKRRQRRFVERPGWQLFAICYLVGVQSSLTTGFVNSCYSTLEKLFNFNSKFTGLIEGSFHAAIVLLVIPVSFYGRKGNKPLIMALGAALIAVGAFCYSSAEFFRDRPFTVLNITTNSKSYNNGAIIPTDFSDAAAAAKSLSPPPAHSESGGGCKQSQDAYSSSSYGTAAAADSHWIKWLFVTGMFLIGVGSTPIQTVAIAYLDQSSSHEENTGWSLGWFHAIGLLAPALGFVLSGSFLSMPIDFSSWTMSKEDDSFMGAWWMGFMLECALALLLIPVLLTLPPNPSHNSLAPQQQQHIATPKKDAIDSRRRRLELVDCEGGKEIRQQQQQQQGSWSPQGEKKQRGHQWREFRQCVQCLMADKTFLCLLMHGSVLHLTTAGLTAFMPKFFETQYRMIAQIAAFVAGGVSVPAAAIGAIISGYVIKRLQLTCLGTIKMTFFAQGTCIILCTLFFIIRCPYGHVYMLEERAQFEEVASIPTSDTLCDGNEMQIHCVNSHYNIYSPCLLKCMQKAGDCSRQNITIESGLCEPGECHWRVPAFMIFFITFLVASMVAVPRIFALLRLVQDEWKTISLGIQWVFFRLLGMIPGPLVYGQIFDSACTQWGSFSMTCSNSHAMGHCSFYNSATLRNYMIAATVGSLVIGEACLFFAIYFYKREHTGPGKKGFICPVAGAAVARDACHQQATVPLPPAEVKLVCRVEEHDNNNSYTHQQQSLYTST